MKRVFVSVIVLILFGSVSLQAQQSFVESTFTDKRDGQEYQIIRIGDRWWMAENMNFELPEGSWCYDDDPMICKKYGRLYSWDAAVKACPDGWHLATDEDWQALELNMGVPEDKLDEMGWRPFTSDALNNNSTGFRLEMAGYRPYGDGAYDDLRDDAYFWTSTSYDKTDAWKRTLDDHRKEIGRGYDSKRKGFSVRCVKDQ